MVGGGSRRTLNSPLSRRSAPESHRAKSTSAPSRRLRRAWLAGSTVVTARLEIRGIYPREQAWVVREPRYSILELLKLLPILPPCRSES
jgi:hypothetical protein